ncbi:MAG: MFS transporter [Chloroflexi bacterium]|nr:MFS transporter [Chloroflexota bacterium]
MTTPQPTVAGVPRDALLLGVCLFLIVSGANILTPLLPAVQQDLGIDYVTAGLLVSAFGIARLAATLPTGLLERRVGRGRLVALGLGIMVAGSVLAAFAPTFTLIVIGRVAMGFGSCIATVITLTSLGSLARDGARAKTLTVFPFANNVGIAAFPLIGGLLGETLGWRSTMLLCGALALLAGAVYLYVLPRTAPRGPGAISATGSSPAVAMSRMRILAIVAIYFGVVIYIANRLGFRNTALPLIAADYLGLEPLQIASGITLMSVTGLLISVPGAAIADRWSRRGLIVVGFCMLAVGDLTFLTASGYSTYLVSAFILGLGDFFSASQMAALTEVVPAEWRGRALSAYRFFVDLGGTVGPAFLAAVLQGGGPVATILAMVALLLVAALGALTGALADRSARATSDASRQAAPQT